jgi:ornithine cyclodeaminase/alanine dehydrogenase-like protein (mu-crystallin family)
LVLSKAEVESLLDLDELVEAVARAMADLSAGNASMPNRIAALVPEHDAFLAAMPAYLPSSRALATKLVSLFPQNRDRPTHQAVVVCFDPDTGTPIALMDAESITAARTAAGSALSTKLLARQDAHVLAILGTGVQARAHARAVVRVRPVERVLIAGRDTEKARALANDLAQELALPVEAAPTFEDAVRGADLVCAATHTTEPVVRRAWVSAGTHITSVGFNAAGRGEVDPETVQASVVVVEQRASALAPPPSGAVELLLPIADGLFDASHIRAELGELVAGTATGRTTPEEITLYKSVGVAVQDAAAASMVLAGARTLGIGTDVTI